MALFVLNIRVRMSFARAGVNELREEIMSKEQTQGSSLRLRFRSEAAQKAYHRTIDLANTVSNSDIRMGAQLKRRRPAKAKSKA